MEPVNILNEPLLFWSRDLMATFFLGLSFLVITGYVIIAFRKLKTANHELKSKVFECNEILQHSNGAAKRSQELAKQVSDSKVTLLTKLNHEVRTGLHGILGMSSLIKEGDLSKEQKEYHEEMRSCIDRLMIVLDEILLNESLRDSEISSFYSEQNYHEFDVENCIENSYSFFASKATENKTNLLLELHKNVPALIAGDEGRLRKIILNILECTIDNCKRGEILTSVEKLFDGEAQGLMLGFSIRYAGCPIPNEMYEKFERLLAGHAQAPMADSSLERVFAAKVLVSKMGGVLEISRNQFHEMTFTFAIRTFGSPQLRSADRSAMDLKKKVLLLSQGHLLGSILRQQLRDIGVATVSAKTSTEALEILDAHQDIDLIIAEDRFDENDLVDLASTIRQKWPAKPIVALTAKNFGDNDFSMFHDVISNPWQRQSLTVRLWEIFNGRSQKDNRTIQHEGETLQQFAEKYPMKILLAEDNRTNQKVALSILSRLGYTADIANNGKEVLEIVSQSRYDLVLMDVQMPDMDGIEATRMIRLCLSTQPVIIAMTATALEGDREKCIRCGMDDFIAKPVRPEHLVQLLQKWAIDLKNPQKV
jgi:CheY-like chemotaxis protein/signal transduction histidine kinase